MENFHILFNDKALLYAQNRPGYSNQVIKYLTENLCLNYSDIGADIGAGTGQLTKLLADNFNTVYAIEPNLSMLQECKKKLLSYTNIIYECSKAESTNLKTHTLDYITVAQAFHLFYNKEVYAEFKRILKPNGKLIIVFNMKNHQSKLFLENEKVLLQYCPFYKREFHATEFKSDTFEEMFSKTSYHFCIFKNDNTEFLDCKTFVNRTLSASYSITPKNPFYEIYVHELQNVFNQFAVNKKVKMELSTVIYSGKLR